MLRLRSCSITCPLAPGVASACNSGAATHVFTRYAALRFEFPEIRKKGREKRQKRESVCPPKGSESGARERDVEEREEFRQRQRKRMRRHTQTELFHHRYRFTFHQPSVSAPGPAQHTSQSQLGAFAKPTITRSPNYTETCRQEESNLTPNKCTQ